MVVHKPSLLRVLSNSWHIIISNSLHFLSLSFIFFFPILVFDIIHTFTSTPPLHSYDPFVSKLPQIHKSQIISLLLHSLLVFLLNHCFIISIINSTFLGFYSKPLKLSSSLKSIISSFFPLLATKIVCMVTIAVIFFGIGLLMGLCFVGLSLLGYTIEPNSRAFMVVMVVVVLVFSIYLNVEWFLIDTSVVVDSKWGFSALRRSWSLVRGGRGVALIMVLFEVLDAVVVGWVWYVSVGYVPMVVRAAVSSLLWLFMLASKTVLFIYCKAFKGELELPAHVKFGQPYIQLSVSHDVEDKLMETV